VKPLQVPSLCFQKCAKLHLFLSEAKDPYWDVYNELKDFSDFRGWKEP